MRTKKLYVASGAITLPRRARSEMEISAVGGARNPDFIFGFKSLKQRSRSKGPRQPALPAVSTATSLRTAAAAGVVT
jgi:hypothetical protein